MSRKPSIFARRAAGGGGIWGLFHPKSRLSPLISVVLLLLGLILVVGSLFHDSGSSGSIKQSVTGIDGDTCSVEVQRVLPILKKPYGENMRRVLYVGPDTCSVVSELLKDEEIEVWGVEPYEIDDVDHDCKNLVQRGFVRVADIKFPLPYRENSFSIVIVSDATDYLSQKSLNKTLPELARVSSDGLVIFTGYPGHSRAKVTERSKFGRPAKMRSSTWWAHFFVQTSFEENEDAIKKFEQAATKSGYIPRCQVFHLKSPLTL